MTIFESALQIFFHCLFGCHWAIPFNSPPPPLLEEQWNSSGVRDKSGGILQG